MWPSVVILQNHFVVSLLVQRLFSSSILGSNALIIVDSDLQWLFRSVWAAHDKLDPSDLTTGKAKASNHGYSALLSMLMHGRAYPTLKAIVVYPLFIASLDTMQKNFSFSGVKVTIYKSLSFNSYDTQCPFFWMVSNVSKPLCDQLLMIRQVQLTPDMSLHKLKFPILRLQTFSVYQRILYLQHHFPLFWSV